MLIILFSHKTHREKIKDIIEEKYIKSVLEVLDDNGRNPYHLRYVEKKSYKEIKSIMRIDEVALRCIHKGQRSHKYPYPKDNQRGIFYCVEIQGK